jgi:hypothetical protein
MGAEDHAGRSIRGGAGGDDVLRGAPEEQAAQQVEAGVLVQVEGDGGEEHHHEAGGRGDEGDEAAGDGEGDVEREGDRVLGMHVGGLDLRAPAHRA